jgi:hypothetical protein
MYKHINILSDKQVLSEIIIHGYNRNIAGKGNGFKMHYSMLSGSGD